MIKFRCPVCTQKIAVNDEGAGAAIDCPNCARTIAVPLATALEFRKPAPRPAPGAQPVALAPAVVINNPVQEMAGQEFQPGAARQLAVLMMDKLVQALLAQRALLMKSQVAATVEMAEIERRLAAVQDKFEFKLGAYEQRINELQRALAAVESENARLVREKLMLAQKAMPYKSDAEADIPGLRRSGFLVGA